VSRDRIAYVVSIWFGCGLAPVAPGTVGSIGALPVYFAVRAVAGSGTRGALAVLAAGLVVTFVGVWASGIAAARARLKDPQFIVVDEAAGTLIALAAAPASLTGVAVAVGLFRLFDIVKPFPARRMERLPGGWGIVLDDVVAGLQAAAVVAALTASGLVT
jgi:phosphatidylglycerophosphatase A